MDGGEPAEILTFCKLEDRRGRGRPKLGWLDSVEKNLKVLNVSKLVAGGTGDGVLKSFCRGGQDINFAVELGRGYLSIRALINFMSVIMDFRESVDPQKSV
jgi:hypothetical protein